MRLPRCDNPFEGDRLNKAHDYHPDLDVPSIGREISESLARDIESIRAKRGSLAAA